MTAGLTSALASSLPGAKKIFSNVDTGIHMRASAARTNLLDIGTAAGGSLFKVDKLGGLTVGPSGSQSVIATYFGSGGSTSCTITGSKLVVAANFYIAFNNVNNVYSAGDDVRLYRDDAGILALKNSTNAQTLRIYGNTTGSKYLQLTHDGTNAKITASSGDVHISNIPTSNPGPGILWNNGGTLAIGT